MTHAHTHANTSCVGSDIIRVFILCSLIDRRGFITEEEEAQSSGVSYGATSLIESVSYMYVCFESVYGARLTFIMYKTSLIL